MKIGKDTAGYVSAIASLFGAKGVAKAAGTVHKIQNPAKSGASNGAKYTDFFSTDNDGPV